LQRYKRLTENGSADSENGELIEIAAPGASKKHIQAPIAPNPLVPYKPSIFGLDKARRDCRFEMIKIVKEVDEVAINPKAAIDPTRTWQYMSPAIFRLLLPVGFNYRLSTLKLRC
jgi:hypothetical protein